MLYPFEIAHFISIAPCCCITGYRSVRQHLFNFDDPAFRKSRHVLTSPRSLRACANLGIKVGRISLRDEMRENALRSIIYMLLLPAAI